VGPGRRLERWRFPENTLLRIKRVALKIRHWLARGWTAGPKAGWPELAGRLHETGPNMIEKGKK
jgi:hypothetical protein